jgi:hypothetical protein
MLSDFSVCHQKWLMLNFDPTPRGRNRVQKNKRTLVYQTELNEELKKK